MVQKEEELRRVSRTLIKNIWNALQSGQKLEGPSENIGEILLQHSEFSKFWEHADSLTDDNINTENGINPFLHLHIHFAVEEQLAQKDPPEIIKIADKLKKHGLTYHEIVHQIGTVFTAELLNMMKEQRDFDKNVYAQKLRQLASDLT